MRLVRRLVFADWQLKVVACAMSLGLWMHVRGESVIQLTLTVPLEFRNPPRSLRLNRRTPSTVEVRVEARRDAIPRLVPRAVRAVVELPRKVTGRRAEVVLGPDQIVKPEGVAVLSISPATLTLEFERGED